MISLQQSGLLKQPHLIMPKHSACLGECFYTGRGVDQSYTAAVEWYSKAAEQDDSEAQCMLGVCYALGRGVERNLE